MRTQLNFFAAVAVATLATACASSRDVEGVTAGASGCIACHGGQDNDTGAPPFAADGVTTTGPRVGAHSAHVDAGIACAACHVDPKLGAAPAHGNGSADVVLGAAARDPDGLATPEYVSGTQTCSSVYCHAPPGVPAGTAPAPTWVAQLTGCGTCHAAAPHGALGALTCGDCHATSIEPGSIPTVVQGGTHANRVAGETAAHAAGWTATDANGVTPHGLAALYRTSDAGLDGCRSCHGSTLDNPLLGGIPTCNACHSGGTAAWQSDCTFCHGDAARAPAGYQLGDAAPPRDVAGGAAPAQVGVHASHLTAPTISAGVTCDSCHAEPTDLAHVNGTADVALKDLAGGASGSYVAASQTCSASACHGAFTGGNATNAPTWTGAGTQTCTSCHGSPPATGRHPGAPNAPSEHDFGCQFCHVEVATNTAVPGIKATGRALHVNGTKNVRISVNGTTGSSATWSGSSCSTVGCHDSAAAYSW